MKTLDRHRIESHLLSIARRLHPSLPVWFGDPAISTNAALASAVQRDGHRLLRRVRAKDVLYKLYPALQQIPARPESLLPRSLHNLPLRSVSSASGELHAIGVTDPTEPTRATGPLPLILPSHVLSGNRPHSGDASVTSTATCSPNARRGSDTSLSRLGCHASLSTISPLTPNSCNGSETHHAR
jgi:hypothetical protein